MAADGTARLRGLAGMRRLALASAVTSVLTALLVVAQANLLTRVLTGAPAAAWGALAAAFALRAGVAWYRRHATAAAAAMVKQHLRHRLFMALGRLGPVRLARERGGELATLAGSGLDGLDAYLTGYLPQRAIAAAVPLAVLAMVAVADPTSAAIIAATLPLVPIFGVLVGKHTRAAAHGQWRALGVLGGHFLDVLRGLPTLQAYGRANHQVGVVGSTAQAYRAATMRTLRIAFLSGLALELVSALSVALVAVPVGLRLGGDLDLATGLLVLLLTPEAYRPLRELGVSFHAAAAGRAAAGRVFAVIDEAPEPATRPAVATPTGHDIQLAHVSVTYPGAGEPALRDVNLRIGAGERVALVGPSGAGKSTLLAVLLGFVPAAGEVVLGGVDLRELHRDGDALAAWRARVAWVGQRPHLFAGTIAENIALGAPAVTPQHIRAAARAASAAPFIEALPDGYATVLTERGAGLSAGQRQRLALARAFLRDAPVLLLDEPTAGLDAAAEADVVAAIRALVRGRTVVVATHRTTLLDDVDRVLTVTDGRVDERSRQAVSA